MQGKKNDIAFLKDWCTSILNFLYQRSEPKSLYANMSNRVIKYFNDKDKREMNFLLMEIHSIVTTSSTEIQLALEEALKDEFGKSFTDVTPIIKKQKSLTDEQNNEMNFIKDWTICIVDFIKKVESSKSRIFFDLLIEGVISARNNNDLAGLKMSFLDINDLARDLTPPHMQQLNSILKEKFGRSLIDDEKQIVKKITKIIEHGRIKDDEEFYLIKSYLDEFIIKHSSNEVDRLKSILLEYETNKKSF